MTASSPSSVSGAAPASTLKRYSMFVDEDRLTVAERDPDGKYVLYDDVAKLLTAPAASREEPSDTTSRSVARLRADLRALGDTITVGHPIQSPGHYAMACFRAAELLAAFSSPSAASPEAIRCAKCGRECEPINESDAPVTHCVECAPPIPSREDARDAARWRFVKPHLGLRREHIGPDVWAHWLALEGESARSGLVDLYHGAMDVGGVDGAVDCAIQSRIPSAVSHPEAQTNGN